MGKDGMTAEEHEGPGSVPDRYTYLEKLRLADSLRGPAIRSAIRALELSSGSRGLDAACGIGQHTLLLAKAVAPGGHVTGIDIAAEFLAYARESARAAGLSDRVLFREGDVNRLPFDDGSFDWVWCVDAVFPGRIAPADDPAGLVREFARVVNPGGSVAILFWSSQQLLPGYPLLEARLDATSPGIAPFSRAMSPGLHLLRALGWLREAGLRDVEAHTFVADAQAPLGDELREALTSTFPMRWGGAEAELTEEERSEFLRLCDPDSPEFILDLPDYYCFVTYSMFRGTVPT
jgi:ubiquinone/menaquinone biosynthesis C-methylase UbiE